MLTLTHSLKAFSEPRPSRMVEMEEANCNFYLSLKIWVYYIVLPSRFLLGKMACKGKEGFTSNSNLGIIAFSQKRVPNVQDYNGKVLNHYSEACVNFYYSEDMVLRYCLYQDTSQPSVQWS